MKSCVRPALLACLCLLAAPCLCLAQRQKEETPPAFEGSSLPLPPRQREPWEPPQTTLPEAFVTATRALFEQGMADPRGGEYREVEVVAAAARMFDTAGSPWLPLIDRDGRESFHRAELLATPMLGVKSFRERVLEGLADKTVVATLSPRHTSEGDVYELNVENTYAAVLVGSSNSSAATYRVPAEDARAPHALEPLNVRACDVYASQLVRLSGAPPFQVYWTEAERDRAVAEMAAFLRDHIGRFETPSGIY